MSDCCLVVIFNHRYDGNIPKLNDIYRDRFSLIKYIIPFYSGDDSDVLTVYESSFRFQGYISQARKELMELGCSYYFFISDDLILNPEINENNFMEKLSLNEGDSFIQGPYAINNEGVSWGSVRLYEALQAFSSSPYVLWERELLSYGDALQKYNKAGFDISLPFDNLRRRFERKEFLRKYGIVRYWKFLNTGKMPYPLLGGYSDYFIVPREEFEIVSVKLGVTAAMGVFAEVAIPTIMFYYCKNLRVIDSTKYERGAMWSADELDKVEKDYDLDINKLITGFPIEKLFLHPIKLSKWKI